MPINLQASPCLLLYPNWKLLFFSNGRYPHYWSNSPPSFAGNKSPNAATRLVGRGTSVRPLSSVLSASCDFPPGATAIDWPKTKRFNTKPLCSLGNMKWPGNDHENYDLPSAWGVPNLEKYTFNGSTRTASNTDPGLKSRHPSVLIQKNLWWSPDMINSGYRQLMTVLIQPG